MSIAAVVASRQGLYESQIIEDILGDILVGSSVDDLQECIEVEICIVWMVRRGFLRKTYGRYYPTFLTESIFDVNWEIPIDGVLR